MPARWGTRSLTSTFARAGKEFGIAVNALGLGLVTTQSNVESMKLTPEELRATWVSLEQIVEAALFLVSPAGDGMNGVVLPVQGKGI
jgi:NAD(P)-dependent dehydrogenase (short-subunit alcohol dehydrogenase family)